jgi:sialidase-1
MSALIVLALAHPLLLLSAREEEQQSSQQQQWLSGAEPVLGNCTQLQTEATCIGRQSPDMPRCAWSKTNATCASRVTQIDVVHGSAYGLANFTTAPWGTHYNCFRVPSVVQTPDKTIFIFFQSHIGSCGDQAPKDVTMKFSTTLGRTWSELMLVIGPTKHKTCSIGQRCFTPCAINNTANTTGCLDFSARNAYATVTKEGGILLGYTDSSACGSAKGCAVNYQTLLEKRSGWKTVNPITRVDIGSCDAVLAGPGAGIVLGRHSTNSPHPGRFIGCGAVGYVGGGAIGMRAWWSDDQGETYTFATGGGLPFLGIGECQAVELTNGSVVVNARNENCSTLAGCTPHHRLYAVSSDGGTTFSAPKFAAGLNEPICSAGLINRAGDLYFSNPDEFGPVSTTMLCFVCHHLALHLTQRYIV